MQRAGRGHENATVSREPQTNAKVDIFVITEVIVVQPSNRFVRLTLIKRYGGTGRKNFSLLQLNVVNRDAVALSPN